MPDPETPRQIAERERHLAERLSGLKSCPFCGGDAEYDMTLARCDYAVQCKKCRCGTSLLNSNMAAARIWNERALLARRETAPEWRDMREAPKDRLIRVYAPGRQGLRPIDCQCQWHDDAGFCVDDLREPAMWCEAAPPVAEGTER